MNSKDIGSNTLFKRVYPQEKGGLVRGFFRPPASSLCRPPCVAIIDGFPRVSGKKSDIED